MAGDIVDSNSAFIAQQLSALGLKVGKKVTIGDELPLIVDTMTDLSKDNDVVIMNGGLGATVDDLTAEAAAVITKKELREHPLAVENITARFGKEFLRENPDYLNHLRKQAILPEGVEILPNPVGLAVGFKIHYNDTIFYFTPGVPREMKVMVTDSILPDIKKEFALKPTYITSKFQVVGVGESKMQRLITESFPERFWEEIDLGFRASTGVVEVKFTVSRESSKPALREAEKRFVTLAPAETIDKGKSIQQFVIDRLKQRNRKLVVMDGCTGGWLFQLISDVSGAQDVFEYGWLVNSGEAAIEFLEKIAEGKPTGLFSSGSDNAMASRILNQSDLLLITDDFDLQRSCHIVTIHWGEIDRLQSRKLEIKRDRETLQRCVSIVALDMLRRYLLNLPKDNPYYFDELTRQALR